MRCKVLQMAVNKGFAIIGFSSPVVLAQAEVFILFVFSKLAFFVERQTFRVARWLKAETAKLSQASQGPS